MQPAYSPTETETRAILDSISDGVFTVDYDFCITFFNSSAEKITGFTSREALGKHCSDIFRSNMCQHNCALKRTMTEKQPFLSSTTRITTKQGKSVPIAVSTSLLRDKDDTILGGIETFRDTSTIEHLKQELEGIVTIDKMSSRNPEMKRIFSILHQIGESDSPVLIEGETGTGKELMARSIHQHSLRRDRSFVAINCGALPDSLLESELFGYKAGAFTGAERDKQGLFSSAGSGTILLDELGDTSPAFQVKILRVLEENEFQPLGSVQTIPTTARVIAATNKNLAEMVESGTFRRDLFYRINVIHLKLPPLRQRKEDIPLLIQRSIDTLNTLKDADVSGLSPEAMVLLLNHSFPGNIRELENILEYAFVLCRSGVIHRHHLPPSLQPSSHTVHAQNEGEGDASQTIRAAVQKTQRQVIIDALDTCQFNRSAAARLLGMHPSTLYRKMKKLNIPLPKTDGRHIRIG